MNYTAKLLIPIAIGVAAALVNSMILAARTAPVEFVRVSQDVPVGTPFTDANLEVIEFPGQEARQLDRTAVPWAEKGVLLGRTAVRDLLGGDLVFYRDFDVRGAQINLYAGEVARSLSLSGMNVSEEVLTIGNDLHVRLEAEEEETADWYGPCRLVAVGGRVSNSVLGDRIGRSGSASETIWVAVPEVPKTPDQRRVVEALDRYDSGRYSKNARVLGVMLSPR